MKSYVQVITTPTADTPDLALMLHFDNKRYLIGSLGEGLQRACLQRGVRFHKLSECFLTGRTEWRNTGGLIGMILTLADVVASSKAAVNEEHVRKAQAKAAKLGCAGDAAKVKALIDEATKDNSTSQLNIFSPPNLNYQLATARRFVFRKGMPINAYELDAESTVQSGDQPIPPFWSDSNIRVWPMAIVPGERPSYRPQNPRKRSFEMIDAETNTRNSTVLSDDIPEHEHHKLVTKSIVEEMFNSSWRLDTLYETRLTDVNMPATIFVRNTKNHKIEKYKGPVPGGPVPMPDPDMIVLVRKPWPGALIESLPPATPAKEAVSYIIRGQMRRGKFDRQKAVELKVPPGPAYSKLSAGESVPNADGVLITSEQVLGPNQPGGGFAIIDLPDETYIDNLLTRPEWQDATVMDGVSAMFWNCGRNVLTDARVKAFMADKSQLKHIVASAERGSNDLAFNSSATAMVKLQQVDSKRFAVPVHNTRAQGVSDLSSNVMLAKPGHTILIEPTFQIKDDDILRPIDAKTTVKSIKPEVHQEVEKAKLALAADQAELERWAQGIPGRDVEITTLGTGSALPSKYRNVSATLMRVPGWGSVLFDCGENTIGQLRRAFPPDEFKKIIAELKVIVISHMHADHHLGTVSVIKAWYQEAHNMVPGSNTSLENLDATTLTKGQQRLAILAEPAMQSWLYEYAAIEDYGYSRLAPLTLLTQYKDTASILRWYTPPHMLRDLDGSQKQSLTKRSEVSPSVLGLSDVQAVHVRHCQGARAVSLTWPDGFKASYSGDCRPSEAFSRIGRGSTVCIHEATFDDELQGDAEAKQHSTTSEALRVAQAMGAKTCVLTHFSQRYQKLPILEYASNSDAGTITQPVPLDGDGEEDTDNAPFDDAGESNGAITYAQQQVGDEGKSYDIAERRESGSKAEAVKIKLTSDMKVCVAFDLMRVKVGEIAEMQYYTPALLKLLEDPDDAEGSANGSATAKTKRRN